MADGLPHGHDEADEEQGGEDAGRGLRRIVGIVFDLDVGWRARGATVRRPDVEHL